VDEQILVLTDRNARTPAFPAPRPGSPVERGAEQAQDDGALRHIPNYKCYPFGYELRQTPRSVKSRLSSQKHHVLKYLRPVMTISRPSGTRAAICPGVEDITWRMQRCSNHWSGR